MLNKIKETIGALLVFVGIIICMFDVNDLKLQIATLCIGTAILLSGALMLWMLEATRGNEEDVYS